MAGPEDQEEPWIVKCAWCGSAKSEDGTWTGAPSAPERTHGICPPCFKAAAPTLPYPA